MNVIHVAYNPSHYGVGTFLLNLMECQKNRYPDLCPAAAFQAPGSNAKAFESLAIPIYGLGHRSARNIRSLLLFYRIFKKYDLVNFHGASPLAFLAAKLAGKKTIYTFHGALGLRGNARDCVVKAFHYFVLPKACDYITFASDASLARFREGFPGIQIKPIKYSIIPYGILLHKVRANLKREDVRTARKWKDKFVIGTISMIHPVKRLEYLVESFSRMKGREGCALVIIGDGDKDYERDLRGFVRRQKLEKDVEFLGRYDLPEVYNLANAFDLFVSSSKIETFGLALLEAMVLGVPCIVVDGSGGAIDILGKSGLIVKTIDEMSQAMDLLKGDISLRTRISASVKKRAEEFDISKTADEFRIIYERLMGSTRP